MECEVVFFTSIRGGFKYDVPHLTNASYQISEGDDPAALLLAELQDSQEGIGTRLIFQRKSLKAFWI